MLGRKVISAMLLALLGTGAAVAEPAATEAMPVGFDELTQGRNLAAIAEIKNNTAVSADDPARLINLAIAYAREGETDRASTHFRAALHSEERASLQTAMGEWVDSRELARQGLKRLARGDFRDESFASLR